MNSKDFSKLTDTSPEAEAVQIALIRTLTPGQRLEKVFALSHEVIQLSKRAIRRRNPGLNENQLKILYLQYFYGPELAEKVRVHLERRAKNDI